MDARRPFNIPLAGKILILAGCVIAHAAAAPADAACRSTIVAQGIRGTLGAVGVAVYESKAGWPDKYEEALLHKAVPAKPGDVAVTVDLPPGRYAVALMHDENGNKRLDRKPSGRPNEGYGMSNNPKVILKTPGFNSAALNLACGDRVLIRIRYPSRKNDKQEDDEESK